MIVFVAIKWATFSQSSQGTPMIQANGINILPNIDSKVRSLNPTRNPNQLTTPFMKAIKDTKATRFAAMPNTSDIAIVAPFDAASITDESCLDYEYIK